MKVLVCGSRTYGASLDYVGIPNPEEREKLEQKREDATKEVRRTLLKLNSMRSIDLVIHGGARGADSVAGKVAEELGIPTRVYPAQWGRYGKSAGMRRNRQMLDEGRPGLVVAFYDGRRTRGTSNMIRIAKEAGVPTVEIGLPLGKERERNEQREANVSKKLHCEGTESIGSDVGRE